MKLNLPEDSNAEAGILSAMIVDADSIPIAINRVLEEDFFRASHRKIFKALRQMFIESSPVDIITLIDKLRENNDLVSVGGEAFINDLSDVALSGANIDIHINIIKDKKTLRDMIIECEKTSMMCRNGDSPTDEIIGNAKEAILKIGIEATNTSHTPENCSNNAMDLIEELRNRNDSFGLITNIPSLDRLIGTILPGQVVVISAQSGVGKTILANQTFFTNVLWREKKGAMFNMEMKNSELTVREVSRISRVPLNVMMEGNINQKDVEKISKAAEHIRSGNFRIDDQRGLSMPQIRARLMRYKAEMGGLDLCLLDYIQIAKGNGDKSREREVANMSLAIAEMAGFFNIPFIILSQLNDDDKLRESRAIEHDADKVIRIKRPHYEKMDKIKIYGKTIEPPEDLALIYVDKNRGGVTGRIESEFHGCFQEFVEWEKEL